jgi:hypothetical protein
MVRISRSGSLEATTVGSGVDSRAGSKIQGKTSMAATHNTAAPTRRRFRTGSIAILHA